MYDHRVRSLSLLVLILLPMLGGCSGGGPPGTQPPPGGADLNGLLQDTISINGNDFFVWLAQTDPQRQAGLMFATAEQMAPLPDGTERGMLFLFSNSFFLSFFMRNTFIPLDLAYIRADGTIAEIYSLIPLNETNVVSGEPVQFALEVNAGVLAALGIGVGDQVILPP